jgi:leader peptidase (prepilin peptidase)/N-methyltransferase
VLATDALPVVAGPFFGSFLLTLALRYPELRGLALGRSACPACGGTLAARDLVPLVSWLSLRGRCRHCGDAIGWIYPAAELAGLGIALWAATVDSGWLLWADCLLGWLLLALSLIDLRSGLLPDFLTMPTLVGGLALTAFAWPEGFLDHLLGAAIGYVSFAAIAWGYRLLRRREGLGRGDAKLLAAGGAWVSWQALPGVVLLAAVLALAIALSLRLARGTSLSATTSVPFGPYLAMAIWLMWLYAPQMVAA